MRIVYLIVFSLSISFAQGQLDTSQIDKKALATAITTEALLYGGLISGLQFIWYKEVPRVPFTFYNDNAGYLQIDKFGHAFGAYLESKICYEWLLKAGVKKEKALIYGGSMGFVLQAPIEVFDGLYQGWGFSWGDILANAGGSAFLIAQEILFDEQRVDFKFSFSRSEYAHEANGMLGNSFLQGIPYDYNGHTYWMSFSPHQAFPKWLNISIGYSANGMFGEFENRRSWKGVTLPQVDRSRQFFISLDVDWTGIETDKLYLRKLFFALNHIKLPFPAIEYNTLGKVRFRPFYF